MLFHQNLIENSFYHLIFILYLYLLHEANIMAVIIISLVKDLWHTLFIFSPFIIYLKFYKFRFFQKLTLY